MKLAQLQEARYAARQKLKLSDFTPGDHIIITSRDRRGTERRFGKVRSVDYNERASRGITFMPAHRDDMLSTGQGHLTPDEIGKGPYGIQHVEIIKHKHTRIQEASYAGDHPVVDWINNFIQRDRPQGAKATKRLDSEEQGYQAQTIITQNFGNPMFMTDHSIEWNVEYNGGLYHVELRFSTRDMSFSDESGIIITKAI